MNLSESPYNLSHSEILELAQLDEIRMGQALLKALRADIEYERKFNEDHPCIVNHGPIDKDIRTRTGLVKGLRRIEEYMAEAKRIIAEESQ